MDLNILRQWNEARGDQTLRLDYPLTDKSVVYDFGGFKGDWSAQIYGRYNCYIFIFEPVNSFYEGIKNRFKGQEEKVHVFNYGISDKNAAVDIHIPVGHDDSSSVVSGATSGAETIETIKLASVSELITHHPEFRDIDLLKINVEGSEFEILEELLDKGLIGKINHLQIQFHDFADNALARREAIRERLNETHKQDYCFPFVWEGWSLK